jgi:hypothetical protein
MLVNCMPASYLFFSFLFLTRIFKGPVRKETEVADPFICLDFDIVAELLLMLFKYSHFLILIDSISISNASMHKNKSHPTCNYYVHLHVHVLTTSGRHAIEQKVEFNNILPLAHHNSSYLHAHQV